MTWRPQLAVLLALLLGGVACNTVTLVFDRDSGLGPGGRGGIGAGGGAGGGSAGAGGVGGGTGGTIATTGGGGSGGGTGGTGGIGGKGGAGGMAGAGGMGGMAGTSVDAGIDGAAGVGGMGGMGGAGGTPGTCNVEGDCKYGLHCNIATKTCVECTANFMTCGFRSGGFTKCDLVASSATANRCVKCVANTDCGSGMICGPLHWCLVSPCMSIGGGNSNCPSNVPKCEDTGITNVNVPICVPCEGTELVCPAGTVCNQAAGACSGCVMDSDCTTGTARLCDPASFTCVQCRTNADCMANSPSTPNCDPTTSVCRP